MNYSNIVVGEHSIRDCGNTESSDGRCGAIRAGVNGNADVGISNDNITENVIHRKSKVS